ncbi:host specificity protein [Salmonella enterica]|nr:host specificity protein [Salmonella enterica]
MVSGWWKKRLRLPGKQPHSTAGLPAMYQTVVFSVYTTSPVVDISVSLRVRGQYTTSASVWPLVMVSRSGNNFTN